MFLCFPFLMVSICIEKRKPKIVHLQVINERLIISVSFVIYREYMYRITFLVPAVSSWPLCCYSFRLTVINWLLHLLMPLHVLLVEVYYSLSSG